MYGAYKEVEYKDQTVLDSKWIVHEKEDGRIKARLCVKGCQEALDPRSDSPTAAKDSMKMFLTITANEGFSMKSLDVTSAFLQGSPLEQDVFVAPPEEREQAHLSALNHSPMANLGYFLMILANLRQFSPLFADFVQFRPLFVYLRQLPSIAAKIVITLKGVFLSLVLISGIF